MDLQLILWKIYIWTQAQICFGLGLGSVSGAINQLSMKDIALLAADEDPKCFTRTQYDLTCFWEESNNKSYKFLYVIDNVSDGTIPEEKLCNVTQQKMDNTTIVHVCSFPASDVHLFTNTHIRVVETSTNITIYHRSIYVEEQVLFDPPTNVSLHVTEEAGQLQVTWCMPEKWREDAEYELKYSSYSLDQKSEQVTTTKLLVHKLNYLAPGEVCSVQMRVMPNGYGMRGHWSDWSHTTMAMVPQNAGDIDLLCHSSDLRNIQCQWNEQTSGESSNYKVFYKLCPSGHWRECTHRETATQCVFPGEQFSAICVKIGSHGPHSRIFYSEPFRMNDSVKTDPPQKLRAEIEGGRACLQWDPPFQNLSRFLMYEIRYSPQGESLWKLVTLQSSETSTCLNLHAESQYKMQIRAKPDGSMYSGFWSDWSSTLTGTVNVPSNIATLLVAFIPFIVCFIPVLLIATFSKHFRRIKHRLWPPVPNLDKVLQDFLTEIHQNCQNPSFKMKQCYDDTVTSVVEIVSEKEALLCGKIQRDAHSLSQPESGERETTAEHMDALEASQDYAILNAESLTPCLWGNEYVYDQRKTQSMGEEVLQMRCHCSCAMTSSCPSTTDIFNQSYLLLSGKPKEPPLKSTAGVVNQYTNLESTAQQTPAD